MAKLAEELQSIRGMNDLMPADSPKWQAMENLIKKMALAYGFSFVRTPIVEPTQLFARAIGEATDIVEKEMYSFSDSLNGQLLTLRPENTASCIRAYYEHGFARSGVQRWFYIGPMFRHERPQKGRYRQFHQFGLEIIGSNSPQADCELISFSANLWKSLSIPEPVLEINSLGVASERQKYREKLITYWLTHKDKLDEESLARVPKNPLRLLDSKNPELKEIIANAPTLLDELGEDSKRILAETINTLNELGIKHILNPRLVRGLDYYNHIVFEWVSDKLGAQATICGGGRYDGLAGYLVGEDLPACGFAIGLERLLSLIPDEHKISTQTKPKIYVVYEGGENSAFAMKIAHSIRGNINENINLTCVFSYSSGKIGGHLKKAVEIGADYAVIVGERERLEESLTIKNLKTQTQEVIKFAEIGNFSWAIS